MPSLPTNPTRIAELDALIAEADEAGADHYDLNGRRDYHRYAAGESFYELRYEAGHDWTAEPGSQSPRYQQWIEGFEAEERLAAAHIVHCVNLHDELVAALRALRDECVKQNIKFGPLLADADAIIARADTKPTFQKDAA